MKPRILMFYSFMFFSMFSLFSVASAAPTVRIQKGSPKPPFDVIQIVKVEIVKTKDFTANTQFTVTIKNKSQKPIEKFSVYLAAKAKGRTIPLAENEIQFEPKAGIEPNETKSTPVKANPFMQKKWSALSHEEIDGAEVVAELISVTFYKEEPIKSDTANAKNANVDDEPLKLTKPDLPKLPKIQFPQKPVNIKRPPSTNRR